MATLLFGGSFNPVHHGHLITALRAAEVVGAARVLLIPAAVSPHKRAAVPAPAHHRLAMLQLAVAGVPGLAVSDIELTRPAPSYTIDTIESLGGAELIMLMGADQLPKFHTWHRVTDILQRVRVAVLRRPGAGADLPALLDPALQPYAGRLIPLNTPLVDISATDIRQRVAAGRPIDFLVPPAVAAYIQQHGLYRA